jgi:uncharacterized membrane protein
MSTRRWTLVGSLLALSAWCVALLEARGHAYGATRYSFLVWNLELAWIPLLLALLLELVARRAAAALAVGALWLLFLPNAPYVLTDFVHLGAEHRTFDVVLVGSFAFTGLALGFASVALVQRTVTRRLGDVAGWAVALGSLAAASVGIYLGRVQNLNSIDAFTRPHRLAAMAQIRLEHPLGNPHLIVFVAALTGFLTLAYVGLQAIARIDVRSDAARPPSA